MALFTDGLQPYTVQPYAVLTMFNTHTLQHTRLARSVAKKRTGEHVSGTLLSQSVPLSRQRRLGSRKNEEEKNFKFCFSLLNFILYTSSFLYSTHHLLISLSLSLSVTLFFLCFLQLSSTLFNSLQLSSTLFNSLRLSSTLFNTRLNLIQAGIIPEDRIVRVYNIVSKSAAPGLVYNIVTLFRVS